MKARNHFLTVAVCLCMYAKVFAQGSSYSNAITVTMDAAVRNYPTSSATGNNVVCTDIDGTPVTWFTFTTNSSGHCPLIYITASDGLPCEVARIIIFQRRSSDSNGTGTIIIGGKFMLPCNGNGTGSTCLNTQIVVFSICYQKCFCRCPYTSTIIKTHTGRYFKIIVDITTNRIIHRHLAGQSI